MIMSLFEEESVQQRIEEGIVRNRQRDVVLLMKGVDGERLVDAPLEVRQVSSDFLFGSNIFMLGGYPSAQANEAYAEAFTRLFNAASVPFYWKGIEPEEGALRFGADSPFVSRRPPPGVVVDFCEAHGLNMNGHCLVWDHNRWSVPEWVVDSQGCAPLLERRIRQIGERYGHRIPRWDVLNEAAGSRHPALRPMPAGYERMAFTWAEQYMPASAHLMINDTTGAAWGPPDIEAGPYFRLIRDLLADGARVDGIGLQWHRFNDTEMQEFMDGKTLRPDRQFSALDTYQAFGCPLHISEITLPEPTFADDPRGAQRDLAVALYRLWFSHPAVHAITWWNLADGGGAPGEDAPSGLLDADLKPKPAYEALHDLIHREWRTGISGRTGADGAFAFRGFHGRYEIRLHGKQVREFYLSGQQAEPMMLDCPVQS